jgi:hypothetical protein
VRSYLPQTHHKKDVVFDESSLIKLDLVDVEVRQEHVPQVQQIQLETHPSSKKEEHEEVPKQEYGDAENIQETMVMPQPSLRRSTWVVNPPTRYDDYVSSVALVSNDGERSCYQEEMKVSKSVKWKESKKEEMDALENNKTWDLVELPKDRKVVGCKWVYKLKKGVDDKVERYKARLLEKGYSRKEDIVFHEIFSLVVMLVSIRVVLALFYLFDLELEYLDVKKMFLHGDLDEDIYVEQLEGFVQNRNKGFICKL